MFILKNYGEKTAVEIPEEVWAQVHRNIKQYFVLVSLQEELYQFIY